jgi:protoheme IX farnesyltransferase
MTDLSIGLSAADPRLSRPRADTRLSDTRLAEPRDFIELLKPRVMSLVVFTALAGLLAAPVHIHPVLGLAALVAIAAGAGAAGALNMWYDADIDAVMSRTCRRPIPSGRVAPGEALGFGLVLALVSVGTLGLVANWLAAGLLAFTIFFYIAVYTVMLKRSTPQNIVIGGAAGAFPPMVGWVAATGTISVESLVLFAIIFLWTPPHFWALALYKADDFETAGVPMMPNVKGADHTRLEILIYTLLLVPATLAPVVFGFGGLAYLGVATITGALMLFLAWRVFRLREGEPALKAARHLFAFSILHLLLLFAVIVADNGIATRFSGIATRFAAVATGFAG